MDDEVSPSHRNSHRRPPNAYLLFCTEVREDLLKREPSLTHKTIMTRLGELWNNLSPDEKRPYQERAKSLQDDFKKIIPEYHYKQKKIKPKTPQQLTKVPGAVCKLPIDPQYLMALGAQVLLHNVNLLQTSTTQPIATVSVLPPSQRAPLVMPPPPTVANKPPPRVAIMTTDKKGVPSMPPPPGYGDEEGEEDAPAIEVTQLKRIKKRIIQTEGQQAPELQKPQPIKISMPKPQQTTVPLIPKAQIAQLAQIALPSMPPPSAPSISVPTVTMPPPSHHPPTMPPPNSALNMSIPRIHAKIPSLPPPPPTK